MTDYKELNALQRDIRRAKKFSEILLSIADMAWTDWETSFLSSIIRQLGERLSEKKKDPLTTRQAAKLIELRDSTIWHHAPAGFSIKSLINDCLLMRHLLDDDEIDFMQRHKEAGSTKLRRREIMFLFRSARKAMVIEPYQGWHLPELDLAAAYQCRPADLHL